MGTEQEKRNRIPKETRAFMITVAVFFDLVGWIPIVNIFSGFLAWMILSFWLMLRGASFTKDESLLMNSFIGFVCSIIPFISWFAPITISTLRNIHSIRASDAKFNKKNEQPAVKKQIPPSVYYEQRYSKTALN